MSFGLEISHLSLIFTKLSDIAKMILQAALLLLVLTLWLLISIFQHIFLRFIIIPNTSPRLSEFYFKILL